MGPSGAIEMVVAKLANGEALCQEGSVQALRNMRKGLPAGSSGQGE